ncbi:hypothetical protein KI387_010706, partial [Taxus chinensis]
MASALLALALISVLAGASVNSISVPRDAELLMTLKRSFSGFPLEDWVNPSNYCNWTGVTCDYFNRSVVALNLQNKSISGTLPLHIPYFRHLISLNLSSNFLTGPIPPSVFASCSPLAYLSLARNNLTGTLPFSLSNCTALKILDLSRNNLTGPIPPTLSKLSHLEQLNFRENHFRGPIPESLSNCTNLVLIDLCMNYYINGTIPVRLGRLTRLQNLCLSFNSLSGSFPATIIRNLTQLRILKLGFNRIGGQIPEWLGEMSYLEELWMGAGLYDGPLPPQLGNISSLRTLAIYNNFFTGSIPKSLGDLSRLTGLSLEYNNLTGSIPAELGNLTHLELMRVGGNSLSGSIPSEYGRLISIQQFSAQYNNFSGRIPAEMGNCSVLALIKLYNNRLSGAIPPQLGRLLLLGELHLEQNQLTGTIPESLSNCTSLQHLSLGYNQLRGKIPPSIASLRNIVHSFSMPHNRLSGQIPAEIGSMISVTVVDLAGNLLSGKITESLGSCVQVLQLNLSNNQFTGPIPRSLRSLITLTGLDLSVNNLSGPIPDYFADMTTLTYLNVSYNRLSGRIPNHGVLKNLSASSFVGNPDLCAQECPVPSSGGLSNWSKFGIIVGSFAFGALVLTAIVYIIYVYRRQIFNLKRNQLQYPTQTQQDLFVEREIVIVSPDELFTATAGFSDENIIGSGKTATVYRGALNISGRQTDIAVKRFKDEMQDNISVDGNLIAEVRALAMARHRNLVRLLGYCLAPMSKALVMDLMSNGTLASHIEQQTLKWESCVRIAWGVAQGLMYLHHECPEPILHCDVKPSNILLGMDFEPAIADFGISRILKYGDNSTSNIKGSFGYMPPEYGFNGRMTAKGDVYGYGVVILEMVSGKNPTSQTFSNENSLPKWALRAAIDGRPLQIIANSFSVLDDALEATEKQM